MLEQAWKEWVRYDVKRRATETVVSSQNGTSLASLRSRLATSRGRTWRSPRSTSSVAVTLGHELRRALRRTVELHVSTVVMLYVLCTFLLEH